ncbi:WD40 repeat-like protein [Trichodelitschia bisporula]|uniref:WD40 repeat-like protein n=1 Tax=Trichodelitschia bisporula TaxID=703511 RepID=A0A6G1I3X0_9PEZI|nr:WD40 repeat-like protein [Trichodelitschia bisporula]
MDVHRSRFVPYPSSAINALAFSHSTGEELGHHTNSLRLAVGRANGDIEIWNPANGAWVHETTFRGGKDRSVEGLAWIQEEDVIDSKGKTSSGALRLFSIGYSSTVTEWDLGTGLPRRHSSGNHSEVWCLAAQPRWRKAKGGEWQGQNLVGGCADGTVAVISTADDDLVFQKFLARPTAKKARTLSITFQNRDTVVAGYADSTIRVYDIRNGSLIRNVTLGGAPKGGPRDILVWAVKCLPNGDIVSGDSTGEVRFFDGSNYSQYQRIAGHEADILDIATSKDGKLVCSTGMDRRTTIYNNSGKRKWAHASHRVYHEHDVKALATFESKSLSIMASGGLDTNLVIVPVRGIWLENHRQVSGLPQTPPVASASSARCIVSWWERQISIWHVKPHKATTEGRVHKLAAQMTLKGEESITSAAITPDGTLLAVASAAEVKVFRLTVRSTTDDSLRVRRVESEVPLPGASLVQFSPDVRWLAMAGPKGISLVCLGNTERGTRIVPHVLRLTRLTRPASKERGDTALGDYLRMVTRMQFSPDGCMLAASDLSGYIDSWVMSGEEIGGPEFAPVASNGTLQQQEEEEDSDDEDDDAAATPAVFGLSWSLNPTAKLLPKLDSAPLVLTFRPNPRPFKRCADACCGHGEADHDEASSDTSDDEHSAPDDELPYRLVVLTAQHNLYELDLAGGRLTNWSRRNAPGSNLPQRFRMILDRAMGAVWHVTRDWERLWVYGTSWVYMFDMAQDFPPVHTKDDAPLVGGKRKREESGAGGRRREHEVKGIKDVRTVAGGKEVKRRRQDETEECAGLESEGETAVVRRRRGSNRDAEAESDAEDGPLQFWYTHKFRPILGLVDVVDPKQPRKRERAVEVVLIERPGWELDLPERFVGTHAR